MEGTVVRLLIAKGFGFISRAEGADVFFHCRELADGLEFDEQLTERRVRFDVVESPKGPRAANVRAAD